MRSPTDVLRDEHRVILGALDLLEAAATRAAAGEPEPAGWWEGAIGWLRSFADRNHHAKEEDALFPAMLKAGVPSGGGPVDVMLEEHEQGRALIATMAADAGRRTEAARAYVRLLRDHIDKENGVLFPLAEAVLDEQAIAGVARSFEQVEAELGAVASIAAAEGVLADLAGRWRSADVPVEFTVDVPGRFLMVDHSISRAMDKGALGAIVVTGEERPDLFRSLTPAVANRPSGH